jgi:hypothetical protein
MAKVRLKAGIDGWQAGRAEDVNYASCRQITAGFAARSIPRDRTVADISRSHPLQHHQLVHFAQLRLQ